MNKAIKRALQEADLRFQCLDIVKGISKNVKELKSNADTVYSYVFHLDKIKDAEVVDDK